MSGGDQQQLRQPSRVAARYLADRGEDHLAWAQATLDLAREMLAGEAIAAPASPDRIISPHYPWEVSKAQAELPRRLWFASVEHFATGEGHSVYFASGLHRDEDEFRREISGRIGRGLANAADLSLDPSALPFAATFLTDGLMANFAEMGEVCPAAMTYLAQYCANYP